MTLRGVKRPFEDSTDRPSAAESDSKNWPKCSTHYRNWFFNSVDKLREIQQNTYNSYLKKLEKKNAETKLPTLEDELWLIKYYSHQLQRFLTKHNFKTNVKETALILFNRFYLKRSLLQYDPRIIMFTCITLSTKLEDIWRNVYIDKLLTNIQDLNIAKVFEMESVVCSALDFNLCIIHITDSIYSVIQLLIEYIKESLNVSDINEYMNIIMQVYKQLELNTLIMFEFPVFVFLYTPTQLVLYSISSVIKNMLSTVISFESFLLKKLLNNDEVLLYKLLNKLNEIHDHHEEFMSFRNNIEKDKARKYEQHK